MIKHLKELVENDVITEETAQRILVYYSTRKKEPQNLLLIVFGILGSLLVGLGIILLLAHNWDNFPTAIRTTLAFTPMLIAQITGGYVLLCKSKSTVWRESSSLLLFLLIGACISLISQIYHITTGDFSSFITIWMLLGLPLIFLFNSAITSAAYLVGITVCIIYNGYYPNHTGDRHYYWLMLIPVLYNYYRLLKTKSQSNFTALHQWLIPISITISLGTITDHNNLITYVAYTSLFGLFYLWGTYPIIQSTQKQNGFFIIGLVSSLFMLFLSSSEEFWKSIFLHRVDSMTVNSPMFASFIILTTLATILWVGRNYKTRFTSVDLIDSIFLLYVFLFAVGLFFPLMAFLSGNIILLATGITTIRRGARTNHIGILNLGLCIIATQIIYRFFDVDLSFALRGALFILVGIGFFTANYLAIRLRNNKKKSYEGE